MGAFNTRVQRCHLRLPRPREDGGPPHRSPEPTKRVEVPPDTETLLEWPVDEDNAGPGWHVRSSSVRSRT
jgi:hypothetical protein